ncbi:MAG: hypothetical protein ACLFR7_01960 [Opitutales bacterium]
MPIPDPDLFHASPEPASNRRHFLVRWAKRVATVEFYGRLTIHSITELFNTLSSDARFDDVTGLLIDFRQVDEIQLNVREEMMVAHLTGVAPSYNRRAPRVAYVFERPEHRIQIESLFARYYRSEWTRRFYEDFPAAQAWIERLTD